jgi:hypothetical protein
MANDSRQHIGWLGPKVPVVDGRHRTLNSGSYLAILISVHESTQPHQSDFLTDPIRRFVPPPSGIRTLMLVAVVAQLLDAATFAIGSQMIGIAYEANGVVQAIYHQAGLSGVLLLKGSAILLTLGVLVILGLRLPRAFLVGVTITAGFGLLGLVTNASTVIHLIG